jgi:hypothetical protein
MSTPTTCTHCGAPVDPAEDACSFCQAKRATGELSAGLDAAGWERMAAPNEIDWGPPLTISLTESPNEKIALRSTVFLDDVSAEVEYRFDAGQGWAKGKTASAIGVSLRASRSDGYDVAVSIAGVFSISRYADGKLAEWLLEPSVHDRVKEGLGASNRLGVTMEGDRISVRLNGRAVASVRDGTRRSGAIELHVRPGSADARVVVTQLAVWEVRQR